MSITCVETAPYRLPDDCALFEGGPLHPLWKRLGFVTPGPRLVDVRTVLIPLVAWLPLLVCSVWEGRAWSGATVPFFLDFEVQARLLVALPLLLWSERYTNAIVCTDFETFVPRKIVREKDLGRYEKILAQGSAWSRSPLTVLLLAGLVVAGHFLWEYLHAVPFGTWIGDPADSGRIRLTGAGRWYSYVAMPVFQFVLYRWYFRLLVWWIVLARVARLDLYLVVNHVDQAAGLGFLGDRVYAFIPFLLAQGALAAGIIGNRILHVHLSLQAQWKEIAAFGAAVLILVLGPLTAFSGALIRAKRKGRGEFSLLASRYVEEFRDKWILGKVPPSEPLVGTPDLQSLADLANSAEVVKGMRFVPFNKTAVMKVVVAFLLPVAPLLLTVVPLQELLLKLLRMFL